MNPSPRGFLGRGPGPNTHCPGRLSVGFAPANLTPARNPARPRGLSPQCDSWLSRNKRPEPGRERQLRAPPSTCSADAPAAKQPPALVCPCGRLVGGAAAPRSSSGRVAMAARGGGSPAGDGLRYAEYSPPSAPGPDAEAHQGLVSAAAAPPAPPAARAALPGARSGRGEGAPPRKRKSETKVEA